jgi:hypothetical protein
MEKIKVTREIDKAIDNTIGDLVNKVTCQLFTKGGKYDYEPLGTGVFLNLGNQYLLLTAAHVAEHIEEGIYIFTHDGKFIPLFGHVEMSCYDSLPKIDVAYVKIQDDLIPIIQKKFNFLGSGHIELAHDPVDAAQYLAFGCPSRNLRSKGNTVYTKAAYFQVKPAQEQVYNFYKFKNDLFYIFEMKGKGIDVRSGEKSKKLGSQVGISGGGLWIIYVEKVGENYIIEFKLAGIMTDERIGKYHCLIANKIDSLISGIAQLESNIEAKKLIDQVPDKKLIYAHRRE